MYSKTIKAASVAQSVHMYVTVLGLIASHYFGSSADHSSLVGNHKMCIGQSTAEVQSSLSQETESKRGDRTAYLILFFFFKSCSPLLLFLTSAFLANVISSKKGFSYTETHLQSTIYIVEILPFYIPKLIQDACLKLA